MAKLTCSEVAELFAKHQEEHGEFDRIPVDQRRHERQDLCGMLLIAERIPANGHPDIVQSADYDQVWFASPRWSDAGWPLTEDDIVYLRRCGIFWDSENCCLCAFV